MTTMAEALAEERAQDEWMIRSTLGKAIHQSLQTIVREPLPNEMALLLLRLAAAQATSSNEAWNGRLSELDIATRHVARGKLIIARQRERIVQLQAEQRSNEDARHMLDTFVETLALLEHHLHLLRDETEGKDQKPEWIFSRLAARIPAAPALTAIAALN
ncbi:hypothetical protein [Methylocystis parvus]|uniref:Uncharacterized protein n=1 Tax=Methylocystis parvus TaxID=134 RepID=A0A6B8M1E2_9HYPH|nr:hypothetical protein [Methylocystis parvus]QGM96066.1 hypothetical protein F7D14_00160 [Methylocystis parvus]WBK00118.1 hypothetical protein MMG94_19460 [Methylocystis parvus OBBP]